MSLSIGQNLNNYNSFFNNNKKTNGQKKSSNSQFDFMTMGTVRNAVIQQTAKENMASRLDKTESNTPTYDKKVTWYGVDITDNPSAYKKLVPISDEVKKEIYENVKGDFERQGKVSKDDIRNIEKFYKIKEKYLSNVKQEDKPKTSWSMNQYHESVHTEIEAKIRELDPKWDWGQPVKKEVLNQVFGNKLDVSI